MGEYSNTWRDWPLRDRPSPLQSRLRETSLRRLNWGDFGGPDRNRRHLGALGANHTPLRPEVVRQAYIIDLSDSTRMPCFP